MLWASNATVTDRKGLTARARFTLTPVQLPSGMARSRGQISLDDEASEFDFDGNYLLQADDGMVLVIWIQSVLLFSPGKNQVFEFHRVRERKPGDRWPEIGD